MLLPQKISRFPKALPLLAVAVCAVAEPGRADEAIRVACVGDSITFGVGTNDPAKEIYPARLQKLLGKRWIVQTYQRRKRLRDQESPLTSLFAATIRPTTKVKAQSTNITAVMI